MINENERNLWDHPNRYPMFLEWCILLFRAMGITEGKSGREVKENVKMAEKGGDAIRSRDKKVEVHFLWEIAKWHLNTERNKME